MARRMRLPETLLALVATALLLNQFGVTVYVLAEHDGDPDFVARYLPDRWFELWMPELLTSAADRWPVPMLLAPTVLVIPAFLELAFAMLVYLVVVRWFDPGLLRRMAAPGLLWATSLSWTATFCLIEVLLANPWTPTDLAARVLAAVATPWLLARLLAPGPAAGGPSPPMSAVGLAVFGASVGAFAWLLLIVYDTVLLYSMGRLPSRAAEASLAVGLLVVMRVLATKLPSPAPSNRPVQAVLVACLRHGLVLFFVPALPIRYAMSYFGGVLLGAGLIAAVAVAAAVLGFRDALRDQSRGEALRIGTAAVIAGASASALGVLAGAAGSSTYVEVAMARAGAVVFAMLVVLVAAADRLLSRHRTPVGD